MIASVHIEWPITLPLAGLAAMALVWYWRRQTRLAMPPSRRRIRHFTTFVMGLCLPVLVLGLSVQDPMIDRRGYVVTWTVVMVLVLVILAGAGADMANNLRLRRHHPKKDIQRSLKRLEDPTRSGAGDGATGDPAS